MFISKNALKPPRLADAMKCFAAVLILCMSVVGAALIAQESVRPDRLDVIPMPSAYDEDSSRGSRVELFCPDPVKSSTVAV